MTRRMYTAAERATIHQHYHSATGEELAAMLGRTMSSVHQCAARMGLSKQPRMPADMLEQVRTLYASGLTDADIARQLGLARRTVTYLRRKRLGLPTNADAVLAARRRAQKAQLASLGIPNPAHLRRISYRKFAASRGWPAELGPRDVQILEALAVAGKPLTKRALATMIGLDIPESMRSRKILKGHGKNSSLAILDGLGLVVRLKRQHRVTGKGRGYSCDLYTLSPAALDIIINRRSA